MALLMMLRSPYQESVKIAYLTRGDVIIDTRIVSLGSLNASMFDPDIILGNVPAGAVKILAAHNHPSGDPSYSIEDVGVTKGLQALANEKGLEIYDHVITDTGKYFSFRDGQVIDLHQLPAGQRRKSKSLRKKQIPAAVLESAEQLADWELVDRPTLPKIGSESEWNAVVAGLRQGSPGYGHVALLNTQNRIVAVHRFQLGESGIPERIRDFVLAERTGTKLLLDIPLPYFQAHPLYKAIAAATQAERLPVTTQPEMDPNWMDTIKILDVMDEDAKSYLAQGLVAEPGEAFGTPAVREAPATYGADPVVQQGVDHLLKKYPDAMPDKAQMRKDLVARFHQKVLPHLDDIYAAIEARKLRGFAKRTAARPDMKQQRSGILGNQANYYQPQSYDEINDQLGTMPDDMLWQRMSETTPGVALNSEENYGVLAGLEYMNRKLQAGEDVQPVIEHLAKMGTSVGQLLRQFGELRNKVPEHLLAMVEKMLAKHKRFLVDGQKQELIRRARADFAARDALRQAEAEYKEDFSEANAKKVDQLNREADKTNRRLINYVRDVSPRSVSEILTLALQGNLLTPMSQVANIAGNLSFVPLQASYRSVAASLDALHTYFTGTSRTVLAPQVGTGAMVRGAGRGVRQAAQQMRYGIESGSVAGEKITGFRPVRSFLQAVKADNLPVDKSGRIPRGDRLKKLLEAFVGSSAEPMLRALAFGDMPFKQGARQRLLTEQGRIRGLKGEELQQFVRFPDRKALTVVDRESREAVFQQENRAANIVYHVKQQLRDIPVAGPTLDVVATMVVPYVKTPVNLAWEGLQFAAPELSLARALFFATKKRRREAYMALGKAVTGQMMLLGAYYLYKHGLMSGDPDKEKKLRGLQYGTLAPNSVNLSGIRRLKQGEDPAWREGDTIMGYNKLGFFGIVANMVASSEDARKKEAVRSGQTPDAAALDYFGRVVNTYPQLASATLNTTMLKGTSTLLEAIESQRYDYWLSSMFQAASSIPLPNTLAAVNRTRMVYLPEMKGDTRLDSFANAVKAKLMMTDDLPLKRDFFGRPIQATPASAEPWVYNFIDVTKQRQIPADPFIRQVWDVYQATGDAGAIPSIPSREYTLPGAPGKRVTLLAAEYDRYQEIVGTQRQRLLANLMRGEQFQRAPAALKVKAMERVFSAGLELAKVQYRRENPLVAQTRR